MRNHRSTCNENDDRSLVNNTADHEWELLNSAQAGDSQAWETVVDRYRNKLRRMIELRMHPQVKRRLDASDVIQETFIEAARVLSTNQQNRDLPVHLWLRRLANQKLIQAHRQHRDAACRTTDREQSRLMTETSSARSIARFLIGDVTSPSHAAIRQEKNQRLETALEQMEPLDREVLVLRHFEQLSGPETAEVLSINHEAVKKRYIRALEKLQKIMSQLGVNE